MHGQRFKGKLVEFGEQVFYFIPKKLRSKLDLRWRIGTYLGNSTTSNEAYVAVSNGDVVKSRSVVRVVAPMRWSKERLMGVKGTPYQLRPQNPDETELLIEEVREPHRDKDAILIDRDGGAPPAASSAKAKDQSQDAEVEIGDAGMKILDAQVRITQKDLDEFGYTTGCSRCEAIQAGSKKWKRSHNDECRLRMYMEYQRSEHPRWKAIRHLLAADDHEKFAPGRVDVEGGSVTPKALDGTNVFDEAVIPLKIMSQIHTPLDQVKTLVTLT